MSDPNVMAFRALILHVKAQGGKLVVKDDGAPLFENLDVTWGPGLITLEMRKAEGSMPLFCTACPPVDVEGVRCDVCPRRVVGERE